MRRAKGGGGLGLSDTRIMDHRKTLAHTFFHTVCERIKPIRKVNAKSERNIAKEDWFW